MTVFERNDRLVCDAFRDGEFDSIEAAGEVSETDFFRAIAGKKILEKLAGSYPTPLKKHDVPVWVYIASNVAMRFHGVHQFHAYPYVVRSGGMVQAFGPQMGHRAIHPETGDVTLECGGFNDKNSYDRQTEPPRVSRRLHYLRRWESLWEEQADMHPRFGNVRYEWWPSTRGSTPHSGRQWRRSLRRSVVPQKHCVSGSGKQSVIWANVGA